MKTEWYKGLTEKQRRFCEFYSASGNALQSAKKAGYKQSHVVGIENLAKPSIKAALETLRAGTTLAAIASREERQTLLSSLMRDAKLTPSERMKAIEILGRAQGDFIDRHELKASGDVTFTMVYQNPKENENKS